MVTLFKPRTRLILFSMINLTFLVLCLQTVSPFPGGGLDRKWQAVALVEKAHEILGTRLLGPEYTPITTTLAPFEAKRLSLHPDFAAVAVHLLMEASIRTGDSVAINLSGSFPGLNIAVLAAVQAVGARPIIVSSVGTSTWGATDPENTWLDMEQALLAAGIWPWHSTAASIGGVGDRGGGLGEEGIAQARLSIKRAGIRAIEAGNLDEAIAQRVSIFKDTNCAFPAALVNVGGNHVFFGSKGHRAPLKEGLSFGYPADIADANGLAAVFLGSNRPVIHFINIRKMATEYGIGFDSIIGSSKVFTSRVLPTRIRWLIVFWLTVVLSVLRYGCKRGYWQ
jgi:poly-gamma-glutamate system protein